MSAHKEAFPDHAVKQTLREFGLERGDDLIVPQMQNELLPRALFGVVKGAVVNAIRCGRKFVREEDVAMARRLAPLPVKAPPEGAGAILDSKPFGQLMEEQIRVWLLLVEKYSGIEVSPLRVSSDVADLMQRYTEGAVRHFTHSMQLRAASARVNVRHFDSCMKDFLRDESYLENMDGFHPVGDSG